MITLPELKAFAMKDLLALEFIISDVYAEVTAGLSKFALFDGGAHTGWHTTRMLDLPGCEKVYAVEADPFMAAGLRESLAARLAADHPKLDLIQKALQSDPNLKSISWRSSKSHVGRSSIVSSNSDRPTIWSAHNDIEYRNEMSVEATTIDQILAGETLALPFIKLDLEGADFVSLKGASKTLREKRPLVIFENAASATEVHDFTEVEAFEYFDSLDYVPMNFLGEPLGRAGWFGFFEAWAAPKEKAGQLATAVQKAVAKRSGGATRQYKNASIKVKENQ